MIRDFVSSIRNSRGFVHGFMGDRDCQIYCNEVSGTIEQGSSPSVPLACTDAYMRRRAYVLESSVPAKVVRE